MPFTKLYAFDTSYPIKHSAIQVAASRSERGVGPAGRLRSTHVIAAALGLLLFTPVTTFSLELGEAAIKSRLGESLLVEIPYRLAANERLAPACVDLARAGISPDGLPTYTGPSRVSISGTHIVISGDSRVREPLISLNIDVHCNTAPHFVRSYQLFVDPPARIPTIVSNRSEGARARQPAAIDAAPVALRQPNASAELAGETAAPTATSGSTASIATTATPRATPSPRARGHAGGNLAQGQTYRVVRGDTLSGIAARIAERPMTIMETAAAIFAANSQAFARGNPDLLQEGRSITIPLLTPAPTTLASSQTPVAAVVETEPPLASPEPTVAPAPVPTSATTQPLPTADPTSIITPPAIEPLPAAGSVVEPVAVSVPGTARTDVAAQPTSPAPMVRISSRLAALVAAGAIIVFLARFAVVRRRKHSNVSEADVTARTSRIRQPVDPVAGIDVVEGRLAAAPPADKTASISRAAAEPTIDPGADVPAEVKDLALTIDSTDSVDLDVGAPVAMNERIDWFAARPGTSNSGNDVAAGDEEASEANIATARMPGVEAAINDDHMTLTIVELDLLRQDYETEHTLTQQASQELRDALADLKATKAARAANPEISTFELPQPAHAETTESAASSQTARLGRK